MLYGCYVKHVCVCVCVTIGGSSGGERGEGTVRGICFIVPLLVYFLSLGLDKWQLCNFTLCHRWSLDEAQLGKRTK